MENNVIKKDILYRHIGKLFYAFASCDKHIRDEELNNLERLVHSEWLPLDKNAIHILDIFKSSDSTNDIANRYFEEFITFKKENNKLFTEELKQLILKTAQVICASVNSVNKSELILLAKLSMNFKK